MLKHLRLLGADTPPAIRRRAAHYRERHGTPPTPEALVKYWAELGVRPVPRAVSVADHALADALAQGDGALARAARLAAAYPGRTIGRSTVSLWHTMLQPHDPGVQAHAVELTLRRCVDNPPTYQHLQAALDEAAREATARAAYVDHDVLPVETEATRQASVDELRAWRERHQAGT